MLLQSGVALGLLASIHPTRNEINTTSEMGTAITPILEKSHPN